MTRKRKQREARADASLTAGEASDSRAPLPTRDTSASSPVRGPGRRLPSEQGAHFQEEDDERSRDQSFGAHRPLKKPRPSSSSSLPTSAQFPAPHHVEQHGQTSGQPSTTAPSLHGLFHPLALSRLQDLPPDLSKYFHSRYDLFTRFDDGISLDAASWFSVTPESIAARIAERCRCHTLLDAFGGAGGNAIQFALVCERVVYVEVDPVKVEMARHNARIYGVEERIVFLCGDVREFAAAHRRARLGGAAGSGDADARWQGAERLDFDVVFLSPPWGGPTYIQPSQASASKSSGQGQDGRAMNARERRRQQRQKQGLTNGSSVAPVRHAGGAEGALLQGEEQGIDSALAAQLGLPLAFTGRFAQTDDADEGNWEAEEEEDEVIVGDVTSTPWIAASAELSKPDPSPSTSAATAALSHAYPLSRLEPSGGKELFELAQSLCASSASSPTQGGKTGGVSLAGTGGSNIALYLPRNVDLHELATLAPSIPPAKRSRASNSQTRQPRRRQQKRTPFVTDDDEEEDDLDSVSDQSGHSDDDDGDEEEDEDEGRSRRKSSPTVRIHLEECWLNGRLKAVCGYFGELASAWDAERDGWR